MPEWLPPEKMDIDIAERLVEHKIQVSEQWLDRQEGNWWITPPHPPRRPPPCQIPRPGRVIIVSALPKTRSGKIVRRALQAILEGRDPGDLSTLEDKSILTQIQENLKAS